MKICTLIQQSGENDCYLFQVDDTLERLEVPKAALVWVSECIVVEGGTYSLNVLRSDLSLVEVGVISGPRFDHVNGTTITVPFEFRFSEPEKPREH